MTSTKSGCRIHYSEKSGCRIHIFNWDVHDIHSVDAAPTPGLTDDGDQIVFKCFNSFKFSTHFQVACQVVSQEGVLRDSQVSKEISTS